MITKLTYEGKKIQSFGIRKLTPFECFRLMGVRDDVIAKMQTTHKVEKKVKDADGNESKQEVDEYLISSSAQYKMAGNSIVVDCLINILEPLAYPSDEMKRVAKVMEGLGENHAIDSDGQISFF